MSNVQTTEKPKSIVIDEKALWHIKEEAIQLYQDVDQPATHRELFWIQAFINHVKWHTGYEIPATVSLRREKR